MSTIIAVSVSILKAWIAVYMVLGLFLGVVMIIQRIKKKKRLIPSSSQPDPIRLSTLDPPDAGAIVLRFPDSGIVQDGKAGAASPGVPGTELVVLGPVLSQPFDRDN